VVDVGVAGTRPPTLWRERGAVGVASEEANRERRSDGVADADGVEDRRRRLLPGDENVLPIGLERESSGEEGPNRKEVIINYQIRKFGKRKPQEATER